MMHFHHGLASGDGWVARYNVPCILHFFGETIFCDFHVFDGLSQVLELFRPQTLVGPCADAQCLDLVFLGVWRIDCIFTRVSFYTVHFSYYLGSRSVTA